jgi:hypothetical protein
MALVSMGKSNCQIDLDPFLIVWTNMESFATSKNIEPIVFYWFILFNVFFSALFFCVGCKLLCVCGMGLMILCWHPQA